MKRILFLLGWLCCVCSLSAQKWEEPYVPAEELGTLGSSTVVYLYNVEADAFFLNGMNWNTNACATRLTNGDKSISEVQRCYAFVADGKVSVQLKNYPEKYLSCLSANANDIYVDAVQGQYFKYTETGVGTRCYTLLSTDYNKELDVTWNRGGHLTLVGGAGHTVWAFMKETSITGGKYALYKARRQLYDLYQVIVEDALLEKYADAIEAAYAVYTSSDATEAGLKKAAKTLFEAVCQDIVTTVDVSFLFENTDMAGYGSCKGWTTAAPQFGWGEFEMWHSSLTLTQTRTVPQGLYDVTFRSLYRQDGSDAAPALTVRASNTVKAEIPSVGSLDYQVTNGTDNNWTSGELYIQPNGMQSGAQALTHTDAEARARNMVVEASGKLTVTAAMPSTSQWLNWQEIRVIYKGMGTQSVKTELKVVVDEATALYGDGTDKGAEALKPVLDKAAGIYDDVAADALSIIEVTQELEKAIDVFRLESASVERPVDYSDYIQNRSFEKGFDHWAEHTGLNVQGNSAFALKSGNTYLEKWVGEGQVVGDAYLVQRVTGLTPGVYILKAAAQNIQQNSETLQKNAFLFAGNSKIEISIANDYSLVFTHIETDLNIGFQAKEATGNWLCCDDFRLYYAGGEMADFAQELQKYIDAGKERLPEKMETVVRTQLTAAIEAAEKELGQPTLEGIVKVSTPLRIAAETADLSMESYRKLQTAIEIAEEKYGEGTMQGADKFQAAIRQAKTVNESLESTREQMAQEVVNLEKAAFAYLLDNPSGAVPIVVTDKRYARGAIAAFGRMTVSGVAGSEIMEQGFCWSTEPDPTVLDYRSTNYLENNGRIYVMDMKPATVYYMRAYAITKNYAVGYGEVIKMSTLPLGSVTYTYDFGGDAAQNNRIESALIEATTYWTNYTSIRGFNVTCVYSPGTPTADCGYGGYMRMGSNMGQRCGTCMHEMNHGIGGGTLEVWGGWVPSFTRTSINGDWAGERTNAVLRFWENREDLVITAAYDGGHWGFRELNGVYSQDNMYLNKYAFNGAHLEPGAWAGPKDWNGTQIVYIGNSLINQAFCEDGLIPVNFYAGAFCLPAYTFVHEDNKKYYIKSESDAHGLYSSYLKEGDRNMIRWVEVSNEGTALNDSSAWYISFNPATQYYQFRNAATGHYLSYSAVGVNGIKAVERAVPASNESFHLMRSRKDLVVGENDDQQTLRGYWVIHPDNKANPDCMTASGSNRISAEAVNLYDTSTSQRWVFLDAEGIADFDRGCMSEVQGGLADLIAKVRKLKSVPHTEDVANADNVLEADLVAIEVAAENVTNVNEVEKLVEEVRIVAANYLSGVTPTNLEKPFELTFMIDNAAIDDNSGWSDTPTFDASCCEYFQRTFDFHQILKHMPRGSFKLTAQAFQRPGEYATAYNNFVNGTNHVSAVLYADDASVKIQHIGSEARRLSLSDDDVTVGNSELYIPNTMAGAAAYFKRRLYNNEVVTSTESNDASLRIGLKCTTSYNGYWTIFDKFRLYFYGSISEDVITGLEEVTTDDASKMEQDVPTGVYNLQGIKVGDSLDGLPKGIYIVGRKKVLK